MRPFSNRSINILSIKTLYNFDNLDTFNRQIANLNHFDDHFIPLAGSFAWASLCIGHTHTPVSRIGLGMEWNRMELLVNSTVIVNRNLCMFWPWKKGPTKQFNLHLKSSIRKIRTALDFGTGGMFNKYENFISTKLISVLHYTFASEINAYALWICSPICGCWHTHSKHVWCSSISLASSKWKKEQNIENRLN